MQSLINLDKKIKIYNFLNKSTNDFILQLTNRIENLKIQNIIIIEKKFIRIHVSTIERQVVYKEKSQDFVEINVIFSR